MYRKSRLILSAALLALGMSAFATAATLYSDNFNLPTDSANWTVNTAPATPAAVPSQQDAVFGYDYSVMGIPAAPGSSDTLGLRLRANVPGTAAAPVTSRPSQTTSGLSVSPTGQNFGTNYGMTFYAWSNFNGSANASGLADNGNSQGGTNNVLFAIGTAGNVPLVVGNTALVAANAGMDGIGFATTGDGGITNDYRVYPQSGTIAPTSTLTAGSYSNTNAYYAGLFPAVPAPAIQQTLSTAEFNDGANNTQAGLTQVGAFGFAWHKVTIIKLNNIVTWDVDDNRIATYDASALTLGGNNIAFGQSDVNATTTRHPSLLFTVFDNLTVFDIPEPSSIGLCMLAFAGLFGARRRGC